MCCPSCGTENREEARFCGACGSALVPAQTREQRKVVTALFCGVWLPYGRMLVDAGRFDDAREVLGEALRLAEIKGTKPYIETARGLLAALPTVRT